MTRKPGLAMLLFMLAACGSAAPPRQLLDARAAYNRARMGKAAQYSPAELHTAKVALNAAEAAFEDDEESPETFALSYVALRTAQLVESKANTKAAEADLLRADEDYQKLTEGELDRTRKELATKGQQLASTSEQLATERKARAEAEERYREAMRKLAEAAAVNVKEEPRGTVIVLPGSVLFATGKSALTPVAQQKLTLIAGTLAPQAEDHDITVEGHTDSRGSRDFNMSLSQDRAQTVMNFLVSRGVPAQAITAVGVGPDRPMADNNTRDGRQENRRVELVIKLRERK